MVSSGAAPEAALLEVLKEVDLVHFQRPLCTDLQLLRLEHFDHVRDDELQQMAGIPLPAVRRLRQAIEARKRRERSKENQRPTGDAVIPFEQIKLMEKLGEGTFAVVKRAIWTSPRGQRIDVAVKILRDASPQVMEDLQQEAGNLLKLQHQNLIRLYGVVENPAMMVFELCEGGCLLDRLRDTSKPALLVTALLDYCQQIATGMTYLENKHCVHRDLATRNILLSADEKLVKICDFGLMRSLEENERLYVMSAQKKVPFAWCPPESLRHRQFSHASDVWAFGVCMWEIFTYGEEPWIGLRGIDVLKKVEEGERLAKPRRCSQQIYDIITLCWKLHPDQRPKFSLLRGFMKEAQLNTADCREAHRPTQDTTLDLAVGDRVVVIEDTGVIWFGQNTRTRQFGSFLRSSVFLNSSRSAAPPAKASSREPLPSLGGMSGGNPKISLPIVGSFIHAGHGDVKGGTSWGQPERIDDIYLKNPIVSKAVQFSNTSSSPSPSSMGPSSSREVPPPLPSKQRPQLPSKPPAMGNAPKRKSEADPFAWSDEDPWTRNQPVAGTFDAAVDNAMAAIRSPPRSQFSPQQKTTFIPQPILAPQSAIPSPAVLKPAPSPTPFVSPPPTKPAQKTSNTPPIPETQRAPLNISSVPRPVSSFRQSPELSTNGKNTTPPQIKAADYTSINNLSQPVKLSTQPMQPIVPLQPAQQPRKASAPIGVNFGGISLTPMNAPHPSSSETTVPRSVVGGIPLHGLSGGASHLKPVQATAPSPASAPTFAISTTTQPLQPMKTIQSPPNTAQKSLVDELSARLGSASSNSTASALAADVRLRPTASFTPQETPCLVHSQMGSLSRSTFAPSERSTIVAGQIPPTVEEIFATSAPQSSRLSMPAVSSTSTAHVSSPQSARLLPSQANILQPTGPDPFEVPSTIRNIAQQERYSQVMERIANKTNASPVASSSHSSNMPPVVPLLPPPLIPIPTSTLQATAPIAQPTTVSLPTPTPATTASAASTSAASLLPAPSQLLFGSTTSGTSSLAPRTTVSMACCDFNFEISHSTTNSTTAVPRSSTASSSSLSTAGLPSYGSLFPNGGPQRPTTTTSTPLPNQPLQPIVLNSQPAMQLFNVNQAASRPAYPLMNTNYNNYSPFTPTFTTGHCGYQPVNWGASTSTVSQLSGGLGGYAATYPSLSNGMGGYGTSSLGGYTGYGGLGSLGSMSSGIGSYSSSLGSMSGSSSATSSARPPPIGFIHTEDILREFDPTFSSRQPSNSTSSSSSTAGLSQVSTRPEHEDLIARLHSEASAYADRARCVHVLENCGWDVQMASREMKIERLTDLGIAGSRAQAESALARSNWDLNAAANAIFDF